MNRCEEIRKELTEINPRDYEDMEESFDALCRTIDLAHDALRIATKYIGWLRDLESCVPFMVNEVLGISYEELWGKEDE